MGDLNMMARKTILQPLLESRSGLHLTIYLINRGNIEDIRSQLRSMIDQSYEYLVPVLSRKKRNKFLEPLDSLISNPETFRQISGNIGIFRTLDSFQVVRVPVEVKTSCHLATSFHVKPLLRWRQEDPDFLLVGIGPRSAHLFSGNQHSFKALDSFHSADIRVDRRELAEWLNECLRKLPMLTSARIFLAGPAELTYRLSKSIEGEIERPTLIDLLFDESNCKEVCHRIRNRLREDSSARAKSFLREFSAADQDGRAQKNVFHISRAAAEGRVTKLVVSSDVDIFGKIEPRSGGLSLHPFDLDHEDDDILDDLAQIVLSNGGEVLVTPKDQIPGERPVLALIDETRRPRYHAVLQAQHEVLEERFG
jgi:hypothetical protein